MSRSVLCLGTIALCAFAAAAQAADATPGSSMKLATTAPVEGGSAATAKPAAGAPACGRRVKVVYAGYGEAERVGCITQASAKAAAH